MRATIPVYKFMNNSSKGGRGKRAPYKTVMCRTPEPIKNTVEELTAKYRELIDNYDNPEDPELIAAVTRIEIDERSIILKSLDDFIEIQKQKYGKNGAQKDKSFNVNTRKWDAFREFVEFVQGNV